MGKPPTFFMLRESRHQPHLRCEALHLLTRIFRLVFCGVFLGGFQQEK